MNDFDNIVKAALQQFLAPADLAAGLSLWQSKYSNRELGGLVAFVEDLQRRHLLDATDKQLLRMQLCRRLSVVDSDAGMVDADDASAAASADQAEQTIAMGIMEKQQAAASPAQIVFSTICENLAENIQKNSGATELNAFKFEVLSYLQQAKLPQLVRHHLQEWIEFKTRLLGIVMPAEHLSAIINILYMAMCKSIGPVVADVVLMKATRQAEAIPEAQDFPPQRLL